MQTFNESFNTDTTIVQLSDGLGGRWHKINYINDDRTIIDCQGLLFTRENVQAYSNTQDAHNENNLIDRRSAEQNFIDKIKNNGGVIYLCQSKHNPKYTYIGALIDIIGGIPKAAEAIGISEYTLNKYPSENSGREATYVIQFALECAAALKVLSPNQVTLN